MYYLAQVNIGHLRAPLSDPTMADYVALRPVMDALARKSPGFIWRRTGPGSTVKETDLYDDQMMIANVSVWSGLDEYIGYVYRSQHLQTFKRGSEWFHHLKGPGYALWWIPQGHLPTAEEARERLEHLRCHGEKPYAFSLKKTFPAPDASTSYEPVRAERDFL